MSNKLGLSLTVCFLMYGFHMLVVGVNCYDEGHIQITKIAGDFLFSCSPTEDK